MTLIHCSYLHINILPSERYRRATETWATSICLGNRAEEIFDPDVFGYLFYNLDTKDDPLFKIHVVSAVMGYIHLHICIYVNLNIFSFVYTHILIPLHTYILTFVSFCCQCQYVSEFLSMQPV